MNELRMLHTYLIARLRVARLEDRGASAIEWAIISAIVVTLALGIYTVISNVVSTRTQEISRG